LAIFEAAGAPLINGQTWPERSEDEQWQQRVVSFLERREVDYGHIALLQQQIPALRYRPIEVSGASAADVSPVVFSEARRLAEALTAWLSR
jgi:hypothetical protein